MCTDDDHIRAFLSALRCQNMSFLSNTATGIAVVLEGRLSNRPSGYLGDLVQCTRLLTSGMTVRGFPGRVMTSHPELLQQNPNHFRLDNVQNVSPQSFCDNNQYWNSIVNLASGYTVLIPTLARCASPLDVRFQIPQLPPNDSGVRVEGNGTDIPYHVIIQKKFWSCGQLHLTEALAAWSMLFGGVSQRSNAVVLTTSTTLPDLTSFRLLNGQIRRDRHRLEGVGQCKVPFLVFPDTAGKPCKTWGREQWEVLLRQIAADFRDRIQFFLYRAHPECAHWNRIRNELVRAGVQVVEFGTGLPEIVALIQSMVTQHANVISLGLDSLPAAHLCPSLGTHSIVIGHKAEEYGGDPFFSAPLSYFGKMSLVLLPDSEPFHAKQVPPGLAVTALGTVIGSFTQ
jgi:hypothetical protein